MTFLSEVRNWGGEKGEPGGGKELGPFSSAELAGFHGGRVSQDWEWCGNTGSCPSPLVLQEVLVAKSIPWLSLTTPVGLFSVAGYRGEITLIT